MTDEERDILLIRMDERVKNILDVNTTQEIHLKELNGSVARNTTQIAVNCSQLDRHKARLRSLEEGRLSRNQKIAGGTGVSAIIITVIIGVGQAAGWW